jgi:ankyrin repeat protein
LSLTPFPNVFEIIRYLALSLDVKMSNKKLDDLTRDPFADYRQIDLMINSVLIEPLSKKITSGFGRSVGKEVRDFIEAYLKLVATQSVDGLTRNQVLSVLGTHWFAPYSLLALKNILLAHPNMPSPILFLGNRDNAIASVFVWIEGNVLNWNEYRSTWVKEKKDQYDSWKKGDHLPDIQSIELLSKLDVYDDISEVDGKRIKLLLIVARAIDFMRISENGGVGFEEARLQLLGVMVDGDLKNILEKLQAESLKAVLLSSPHLIHLRQYLKTDIPKSVKIRSDTRYHLDELNFKLKSIDKYETSKNDALHLEALWYVFFGNLKDACQYYEEAVSTSIYLDGPKLKKLIQEALTVAARQRDKSLLRKLKNIQILLEFDLISVNQEAVNKPSKKYEEVFQSQEIDWWSAHFDNIFPLKYSYGRTETEQGEKGVGVLFYSEEQNIKPDYRNPNRKIKIGESWSKVFPQIVWFTLQNDIAAVKRLLEKGARVDAVSSAGDTALIMALEKLSLLETPVGTLDDSFFHLIASAKNIKSSVNFQTDKRKITPIIQAVQSGRPDIVKKLIDLGADVDFRGETDNQTALNVCIKLMGIIKRPKEWLEIQLKHPVNDELLDSLRRHSNGMLGADLESQKRFIEHPEYESSNRSRSEEIVSNLLINSNITDFRTILTLLLEAGANPNSTMASPVKGYTPTMLAVELDFSDELSILLTYGADLDKTFCAPVTEYMGNSWELAEHYKSGSVLKLMEDIRPYYSSNKAILH